MSMWDEVKKNLVEWYGVTHDKTTEVARVTSLRYDKFGISRDIERQLGELGNLVYTALKEGDLPSRDNPELKAAVARLEALEAELMAKEREISEVRARSAGSRAARGAATVDPQKDAAPEESAESATASEPLVGPVRTQDHEADGDADHPQMGD